MVSHSGVVINGKEVMTARFSDSVKPDYWDDALRHLMRRDRILRRLIPAYSDVWLREAPSAFVTLTRVIISQQLSVKAANEMWGRFVQACGTAEPDPETVLELAASDQGLSCLTKRKGEYVLGVAEHFSSKWVELPCWDKADDETVIADLCTIRGVGRWTAEMFLIFNLQRPDVLPLDDASLLKAISLHYFSGEPVSRFEAREVAQAWAPWRTVAVWYLWHSLDPASVRY